jgi:glycosyltransferase involved in cell wall biosynthesis
MRIAFNALSATHLSGRHVLSGHIREVIKAGMGSHLLLYHNSNRDLVEALGPAIDAHECPPYTAHWAGRRLWEQTQLGALLKRERVDLLFSPAGTAVPGLGVSQLVLTQNPWAFVPSGQTQRGDRIKAALQRKAYRRAQRQAAVMLYNSHYMQSLYVANAGRAASRSLVLYQGIDESTFLAAHHPLSFEQRKAKVLAVSAMAPHKCIEDTLAAVGILRQQGISVSLELVGPWPDSRYYQQIIRKITALGLDDAVVVRGKVSDTVRNQSYREARVFCLLSRCESFGIPAIEAQAFGTPTVVANCGAAPEIAGPGGVVVPAGDHLAAAQALLPLLTDPAQWRQASKRAIQNAERFRWNQCSAPLLSLLANN